MNRVLFSSMSDHWSTPDSVKRELDKEFHTDFDPCPLYSKVSGLHVAWRGRVFCNPPYSQIDEFFRKGLWHLSAGDCELIVFLVPARTDTKWFHDFALKADEIRFIKGRLKFGQAKSGAPFPSMLVIFKAWPAGAVTASPESYRQLRLA